MLSKKKQKKIGKCKSDRATSSYTLVNANAGGENKKNLANGSWTTLIKRFDDMKNLEFVMPEFWRRNQNPFFTMIKIDFDCDLSNLWLKNKKITFFWKAYILLS